MPGWLATILSRLFNRLFRVQILCDDVETLYNHQGFLLPNHMSYLDITVMMALRPVRYLAAIEVEKRPGIGQMATAVGTVYVDRESSTSRREALESIVDVFKEKPDPPIVIYPEGRLGMGDKLFPFKYGAFKLAVEHGIPYMPVAIRYCCPDIVVWRGAIGENLVDSVWRLAQYGGKVPVEVTFLDPILPSPDDDPVQLAAEAQYAVEEALGYPHASAVVEGKERPETGDQRPTTAEQDERQ
jgi:1-acyl-sn-glycerol-3-phosphate acyltransferase